MDVKPRIGPDLIAALLAILMPSAALGAWLPVHAALPIESPVLTLPADQVRAAIAADRRRAQAAPEDELESRRRTLYLELGLAESRPEEPAAGAARRRALAAALEEIVRVHGEDAVAAIRARDVERMIPALAGQGDPIERARELGSFSQALSRWGAIVEGRRVASEYVIRALFAARWNVAHGRPASSGFGRLRLRAYEGWLALHGEAASPELRADALDAYEAAGGSDADEARAILAWRAGDRASAAAAFGALYERTGNLRFRNHQAAALASR